MVKSEHAGEVMHLLISNAHQLVQQSVGDAAGIALVDIDRFHDINVAFGRLAGNRLLVEASRRIASVAGADAVHRIGDDEFLVFLRSCDDPAAMLEAIRLAFDKPFEPAAGHLIYTAVSIGAAVHRPEEPRSADRLLRQASIALRYAKRMGKNRWYVYDPKIPSVSAEQLELVCELRQAIRTEQLELYYQPRLDLISEKVICLEALVRWNHPRRGLVMPREFIPAAEESGLIIELGDWVLRRACEQKRRWIESGIIPVQISVNISPLQFRDAAFATRVLQILEETGMHPRGLELEITESSVMENIEQAREMLSMLNVNGCSISIDDFGTGHSSLNRLKLFPVKCLKIDRSFVQNMTSDRNDLAITHAIINLGHSLNLQVVAEGVEDRNQLELLKEASCTTIQGYLLSPPMKAVDLEQLFREEKLVC